MPPTQLDKAQIDKARQFRALHEAPEAFVVANVWDGGSARMMAALGFAALATSSGASAGMLGRRDGRVARDEAMAQARGLCGAPDLAVPADLAEGGGPGPAGLRGSGEGLRGCARNRGRDDPAGGRSGAGRVLDRGCERQS